MTTLFVVVIAASVVVVVLDAYWPHRPGPTYINPGKKSQSTRSLVSRYITCVYMNYGIINELRNYTA